jgi:colanic acid biosynthesis glycosyl transferase WcaI
MTSQSPFSILVLNQPFYPDVASTAQHLSDLAVALAQRGHSVTALASARCYDNPAQSYPRRERWRGIDIRRIRSTGYGKTARWRRAVDFASYLANCAWNLARMPRHDVVIALTTPPLISFLGALMVRLKGGRLVFWVMDVNPDEAVAAGWLNASSGVARVLQKMLRYSLHSAENVIALDRFMAERLIEKETPREKVSILPPWSHNEAAFFDAAGRERFRAAHNLGGKFVVMYSGNHSPCHPLRTLLLAAKELRERSDIHFAFIGGGSEFGAVKQFAAEHALTNILTLPYQPLDRLSASLSAADLHAVVMGDPFVGIVHPCKIYNILALGTPVLYVGPEESHIGDMIAREDAPSWIYGARHGEVGRVVDHIVRAKDRALLQIPEEIGAAGSFAHHALLGPHVAAIERAGRAGLSSASPQRPPREPSKSFITKSFSNKSSVNKSSIN